MPDLIHAFDGSDLRFLQMVAALWGIELDAPDAQSARTALANAMLNPELVKEMVESLPAEQRTALQTLLHNERHLSWPQFSRRFGEVRTMGAARRDRERPDLNPASVAEALCYRGLIGKAFLNLPPAPEEYAYLPDDLAALIVLPAEKSPGPFGWPAVPSMVTQPIPADDGILDSICTLLAALRMGKDVGSLQMTRTQVPLNVLMDLLTSCGLCDEHGQVIPEPTRAFLEAGRSASLAMLVSAWMGSPDFNELRLLPHLVHEGDWHNDPLEARNAVLEILNQIPENTWWDLESFISSVHEHQPDFQRPGGDYDSWFIRRASDQTYLRGFKSWAEVDGSLLRFIITGPLHWLGLFDLAKPASRDNVSAFRPSAWAPALLQGKPPPGLPPEARKIKASLDGLLRLPARTPLSARYQIARFCEWEKERRSEYRYRLTANSLKQALDSGLKPTHLEILLQRYVSPLPQNLLEALARWEDHGVQAHLEKAVLLQVGSSEILEALQETAAAQHLGAILNPTTVTIKAGHEQSVRDALVEIGYLTEIL